MPNVTRDDGKSLDPLIECAACGQPLTLNRLAPRCKHCGTVDPGRTSGALSKAEMNLLELQDRLHRQGEERGDIAFTSPLWARFSLPHRNPASAPAWESRNGGVSLILTPGMKRDENGKLISAGYPFGVIPRLALTYMTTAAVRTKEPEIHLGDSQRDFLSRIGMDNPGQKDRHRIRYQIEALASCDIKIDQWGRNETGWGYRWERLPITSGLSLWLNAEGEGQPALWGSTVRLSDEFFQTLIDAPMPVYLEDLEALGSSSLRHDIYVWLVYRLWKLDKQTHISWQQLHAQFGSSYKQLRQFKPRFRDALRHVLMVYPEANVTFADTDTKLILRPSKKHIRALTER
ncbi:replication protein RepA [Microbacterium sp.]|uniref:replication protein RepA n=1 Tax=Microbacterium sp. TaxID=51671 RepID=UPI003F9C60E6